MISKATTVSFFYSSILNSLQPLVWWPTWPRLLRTTPPSWLPGSCLTASTASSQSLLWRQNTPAQGRQSARWRSTQRTSWPERCLTAMYFILPSPFVFLTELLLWEVPFSVMIIDACRAQGQDCFLLCFSLCVRPVWFCMSRMQLISCPGRLSVPWR